MQATKVYQTLALLLLWSISLSEAQTEHHLIETSETAKEYDASEVIGKTPSQLLKMRGFGAETHYARTKDGYHIHMVRVINPKIHEQDLKRPVVFNHGLLESSTIWLINARGVAPSNSIHQCGLIPIETLSGNSTYYLNGPMMLANNGYDVWLMSMRGTDWSLKHDNLKPEDGRFWDYCLDDFALTDIPTVIDYVKRRSKFPKVGYLGHSQATFSIFGLLATKPDYADIIEPVIAVAPVSYFDHITSISRALFLGTLTATSKDHHGPFPPNSRKMRKIFDTICAKTLSINKLACDIVHTLVSGNGRKLAKGFFSHLPFYTSLKVLRHFGQLVKHKRFMRYDYGKADNLRIYGSEESPSYEIKNIRSESICLISTKEDALSPPADVEHFKSELKVPLYRDISIEGDFNHFDLITDPDSKRLVFPHVLEIFDSIETRSGVCSHNVHSGELGVQIEAVQNVEHPSDHNEAIHNVAHPLDQIEAVHNVEHPSDRNEASHNDVHPLGQIEAVHNEIHPLDRNEAIHNDVHPLDQIEADHNEIHPLDRNEAIHDDMFDHEQIDEPDRGPIDDVPNIEEVA